MFTMVIHVFCKQQVDPNSVNNLSFCISVYQLKYTDTFDITTCIAVVTGDSVTKRLKQMENKFKSQKSVEKQSKEMVSPTAYWTELYKNNTFILWEK